MEGGVTATVLGGRIGWMSHPKGVPLLPIRRQWQGTRDCRFVIDPTPVESFSRENIDLWRAMEKAIERTAWKQLPGFAGVRLTPREAEAIAPTTGSVRTAAAAVW